MADSRNQKKLDVLEILSRQYNECLNYFAKLKLLTSFKFFCMRYFIFWINICFIFNLFSQLPSKYQVRFGSVGDDAANAIIKETDGSYILTGYSVDTMSNQTRTFAWKISNTFSMVWQKSFGNDIGQGKSIKKVFNNGYVVCGFISNTITGYDGYIIRLNQNGDTLWTKNVGTNAWDFLNKIIVTPDSGFIAVGKSYGTATFDSDAWIIKLDKNGNTVWSKFYGGFEDDELNGIEIINNNCIAVGISRSNGDLNGDAYCIKFNANGDSIKTKVIPKAGIDIYNGILKVNNNTFHCIGGSIESPRIVMSNAQFGIDSNLNVINTYTNFNTYLNPFSYYNDATLLTDNRISNTGVSNQGFTKHDAISQIETVNGNNQFFTFVGGSTSHNEEGYGICANFEDTTHSICGYTEALGSIQKDVFIAKCDKTGLTLFAPLPLTNYQVPGDERKYIVIWSNKHSIIVQNNSKMNFSLEVLDITGKALRKSNIEANSTAELTEIESKIIITKAITKKNVYTQKILLD
jgi:hypothetical protein